MGGEAAAYHAACVRSSCQDQPFCSHPFPGPGRRGPLMTSVATLVASRAGDDRPGVLDASGTWTWRQAVAEGAARGALAHSLRGDGPFHIGVLLPNGPEYLFWLNGAALAGAAIVGVNPTRRGEALAADIRATDCGLMVTDAEGAALLVGLDLGLADDRILVMDSPSYAERLAAFSASDEATAGPARALVAAADQVDDDALFQLIFTSGTTGTPKAVRCTQGRLAGIAEVAAPGYGYKPDDVCYCPMPLFHGNALMALWGPAVMVGAAIAVRPRFSASAFMDDVRRFGATKFSYVGKAIAYILATPERPDDADNTLRSAFGTEASVRDRDRFRKRFGCYLIEGYGQSEGGAAINPTLGMPKGALGKPVDGIDLAVISPETGEQCPPARFDESGRLLNAGEATGEIVNRSGRGKFEGYYKHEQAEQDRLRSGWYWTGDLGYVDADGFFYFAGRSGDWLRVDSENFAAGPVEGVLSRHPDIAVSAVYPVPDTASGAGDQVMVAIELLPGLAFDPAAFTVWLAEQPDMGTKWVPRFVRISPSLPQTATGKVTKVGLRQEAWLTDDAVWWQPRGEVVYRRLTEADRAVLAAGLAEHGRPPLVAPTG
jgi:fatty-acyl-CoA synthase